MKTSFKLWVGMVVSSMFLAGCCAPQHVTRWEYKVVRAPDFDQKGPAEWRNKQEALMNELGKQGWIFVSESDRVLYFKRPLE